MPAIIKAPKIKPPCLAAFSFHAELKYSKSDRNGADEDRRAGYAKCKPPRVRYRPAVNNVIHASPRRGISQVLDCLALDRERHPVPVAAEGDTAHLVPQDSGGRRLGHFRRRRTE